MEAAYDPVPEIAQLDETEQILADVEASLARLEDGSWSACELCRQALDPQELDEVPYLRRCLSHRG